MADGVSPTVLKSLETLFCRPARSPGFRTAPCWNGSSTAPTRSVRGPSRPWWNGTGRWSAASAPAACSATRTMPRTQRRLPQLPRARPQGPGRSGRRIRSPAGCTWGVAGSRRGPGQGRRRQPPWRASELGRGAEQGARARRGQERKSAPDLAGSSTRSSAGSPRSSGSPDRALPPGGSEPRASQRNGLAARSGRSRAAWARGRARLRSMGYDPPRRGAGGRYLAAALAPDPAEAAVPERWKQATVKAVAVRRAAAARPRPPRSRRRSPRWLKEPWKAMLLKKLKSAAAFAIVLGTAASRPGDRHAVRRRLAAARGVRHAPSHDDEQRHDDRVWSPSGVGPVRPEDLVREAGRHATRRGSPGVVDLPHERIDTPARTLRRRPDPCERRTGQGDPQVAAHGDQRLLGRPADPGTASRFRAWSTTSPRSPASDRTDPQCGPGPDRRWPLEDREAAHDGTGGYFDCPGATQVLLRQGPSLRRRDRDRGRPEHHRPG